MNPGIDFIKTLAAGRQLWRIALVMAAVAALAATVFVSGGQHASAQDFPTEISGRVVMGTAGEELPVGLNVVLLVVDETQQDIIASDSQVVGTNGQFSFTDFLSGPGFTYRVAVDDGSDFTPSTDVVPGEDSFTDVEITTYARTSSFDDIRASTYSMWVTDIDRKDRLMGVLGVISLVNSGDRVWLPDLDDPQLTGLDLLRFSIPEGYSDLGVETTLPNGNILEIGTGFAMTNPVPPGEYQVLFTFITDYEGDSMEFPLNLPFGADQVKFLMPDGEGVVTGDGLSDPEGVFFENTPYSVVQGENYERGTRLDATFGSLPTPSLVESMQAFLQGRTYIVVIAWVAGVVMLALLVYAFFFTRQRRAVMQDGGGATYPEYQGLERAEIVETIATLDEQHDSGEIEEEDYTERRAYLTRTALSSKVTTETQLT